MIIREGLSYDDVLLVPKHSTIVSRSKVDVSVHMGHLKFDHPIIPANMASIMGKEMCLATINNGGLAILHRFMDEKEQLLIADQIISDYKDTHFAVSIGVKPADRELFRHFYDTGVKIVCIDIAHGDSEPCVKMCQWLRKNYPDVFIIAGNVATEGGAGRLWEAGANAVKANIGSGSICSTRIMTGNGVPSITSLIDVVEARRKLQIRGDINRAMYIIADGGIRNSGDLVKALCFADMAMCGSIFAGCLETPGKKVNIDGRTYKEYVGSSTHKNTHIEGVSALVSFQQESYQLVLDKMLQGLRSGCSYQNADNLDELKEDVELIRITNSGLIESHPHSVKVIK
jgi:IMP dehydrogenase